MFRKVSSVSVQTEQVVVAMETLPCEEQPEILSSFSSLQVQIGFSHGDAG